MTSLADGGKTFQQPKIRIETNLSRIALNRTQITVKTNTLVVERVTAFQAT